MGSFCYNVSEQPNRKLPSKVKKCTLINYPKPQSNFTVGSHFPWCLLMINFMIRTSNLKHLFKVVGHIRWVGLHSGPLRQNPPPIAAPHHPFVLILPPVRRHPILTPQEIAAFVDEGDIPLLCERSRISLTLKTSGTTMIIMFKEK
jgi:hypothetical protein